MSLVQRLNDGRPIIEKDPAHPWENRVTFNPACVLIDTRDELDRIIPQFPFTRQVQQSLLSYPALCFLLYRAQGTKTPEFDYRHSSIGLAVLTPELRLLARHDTPVLFPDRDFDNLGVEDPRITHVHDRYVMFYTAYGSAEASNSIRIGVATSSNLFQWEKHGLLQGDLNTIDNKNAMLFPDRINGRLVMLHRPMSGDNAMAIHLATSDNILGPWKNLGVLMKPYTNERFVDTWIGGGAPPLRLQDGRYLLLYHIGNRAGDSSREYDLGIALCDTGKEEWIVKRNEPLLRPETPYETVGDADLGVNNVVFICGAYFHSDNLYFPYAGSDSVILAGKISRDSLHRYLTT